jgi:beta-glucuronidase
MDPQNIGQDKQWFASLFADADSTPIRIAEHWEKQGHIYDGIAWYARSIDIPAGLVGRKISLVFMGVDEKAWVYLNGELVGSHADGDPGVMWTTPFVIDLTGKAKLGQPNTLVVRVHDTAAAGGIWKPIYLRSE